MTHLSSLNFVPTPKQVSSDPKAVRRQRLIERLEEQKQLLKDPTFTPVSKRWKKAADGSKTLVDHYRRLKRKHPAWAAGLIPCCVRRLRSTSSPCGFR